MVVRRRRPHHWMDGMMEPLGSVMPLLVQPTGTRLLDTVGRVVPVNDEWDEDVDVVASYYCCCYATAVGTQNNIMDRSMSPVRTNTNGYRCF